MLNTAEAFHNFAVAMFRQRAGCELVRRGAYRLISSSQTPHSRTTWEAFIQPGVEILMSAVLAVSSRTQCVRYITCPNCLKQNPYVAGLLERVQW